MAKDLLEMVEQINIMGNLAMKTNYARGSSLKQRANDDLEKIARSAWLNIYEYLSDNGIDPDKYFTTRHDGKKNSNK